MEVNEERPSLVTEGDTSKPELLESKNNWIDIINEFSRKFYGGGQLYTQINSDSVCFTVKEKPYQIVADNIKSFEEQLNNWKKLIYKDKSNFTGYKLFIDTMKEDFDKTKDKFDYFYEKYDLDDEDFFFIANFYHNSDYLPECLREDYKEIYGGN